MYSLNVEIPATTWKCNTFIVHVAILPILSIQRHITLCARVRLQSLIVALHVYSSSKCIYYLLSHLNDKRNKKPPTSTLGNKCRFCPGDFVVLYAWFMLFQYTQVSDLPGGLFVGLLFCPMYYFAILYSFYTINTRLLLFLMFSITSLQFNSINNKKTYNYYVINIT